MSVNLTLRNEDVKLIYDLLIEKSVEIQMREGVEGVEEGDKEAKNEELKQVDFIIQEILAQSKK